jgi:hypothetical protein
MASKEQIALMGNYIPVYPRPHYEAAWSARLRSVSRSGLGRVFSSDLMAFSAVSGIGSGGLHSTGRPRLGLALSDIPILRFLRVLGHAQCSYCCFSIIYWMQQHPATQVWR